MIATGKSIPYILKPTEPYPLTGVDLTELVYCGGFIQFNPDYTGSAIRVRRTSDGAELDVGFTNRIVNPQDLIDFGSDVTLTTIYDQVGTGVNWTEPATATQLQLVNSGVAVTQGSGIQGALNPVGFHNALSSSFTMPKDYVEMSGYSSEVGGQLLGKGGSWTANSTNGFRNIALDSGGVESQQRIYSSAAGLIVNTGMVDVLSPANGVHYSMYCDDTNGAGIIRNQDTEITPSWTANSRTGATSKTVWFNRFISLSSGNLTQHYSLMFNTADDRALVESRIYNVMGI